MSEDREEKEIRTEEPAKEREIGRIATVSIDGSPVSYVVALAAVVAVLAFIPMSVIVSIGGSFPLSQGVLPLVGFVLGPFAGAAANVIGVVVGIFIAPHTSGVPFVSVISAALVAFFAGTMVLGGKRKFWYLINSAFVLIGMIVIGARAVFINGVRPWVMPAFFAQHIVCLILYTLPTRKLLSKWISSGNAAKLAASLFIATWINSAMINVIGTVFTYYMYNWPEEVFVVLIPVIPVEMIFRSVTGAVIGAGVITGLRGIGLVKPKNALY